MDLPFFLDFIEPSSASPTGAVWAANFKRHKKGENLGYLTADKRYWRQKVNNKQYAVHNLIWMKINGSIPDTKTVDHIDRNGLNNDINNLRLAETIEQLQNRKGWGFCKFRGVSKYKNQRNFAAYIMYPKYGRVHLGYYKFAEHAAIAHDIASVILFDNNKHYKINYEQAFWLTEDTYISKKVVDKINRFIETV